MKRQAAVFVTVPADALVGEFRLRHQPRAVARRLPPHVTIVPPFPLDDADDDDLGAELATHFATLAPFDAELARVGTFERHVWLAPEPIAAFVDLIISTRQAVSRPRRRRRAAARPASDDRGGRARRVDGVGSPSSPNRSSGRASRSASPCGSFALWAVAPDGWHELRRLELG